MFRWNVTVVSLLIASPCFGQGLKRVKSFEHGRSILSVAFSKDGKLVGTGGIDGVTKIWEIESGKCVLSLNGHAKGVCGISFSKNANFVITCGWDRRAIIWNASTGIEHARYENRENAFSASGVNWSNDSVALGDKRGDVTIMTLEGKAVSNWRTHNDEVRCVTFSKDGQYLASGGADALAKVWKVQDSPSLLTTLKGHDDFVLSVAFSDDGKSLASGGADQNVFVWDVRRSAIIRQRRSNNPEESEVCGIGFLSEAGSLVWSSGRQGVLTWSPKQKDPTRFAPDAAYINCFAVTESKAKIVTGTREGLAWVWEVEK
jgi:WD40 repeat protein